MKNTKLLILESAGKIKTIKNFLDSSWNIISCVGHVRSIEPKQSSCKVEGNKLNITWSYTSVLSKIVNAAKTSTKIYIATDPDREGHHIAQSIKEELEKENIKASLIERVVYNEITKAAITKAINNTVPFDVNQSNSSIARTCLDFIFGFWVSPVLWKALPVAKSGGRVQSCALSILCDREKEILFQPFTKYHLIHPVIKNNEKILNETFKLKNNHFVSKEESEAFINKYLGNFEVSSLSDKITYEGSDTRLKTSSMQKATNTQYYWGGEKTMKVAQQLYEKGLITYLRTDSTKYSDEFLQSGKDYITKTYGKEFLNIDRTDKISITKDQEAHEGIRPTNIENNPKDIQDLTEDELKLYDLIWKSSVKYFIRNSEFTTQAVLIRFTNLKEEFQVSHKYISKNYHHILDIVNNKKIEDFKSYVKNNLTFCTKLYETPQKKRYTEGSLIQTLEKENIGRPSSWATIVSVLVKRKYIQLQGTSLVPTRMGISKNTFLNVYMKEYIETSFTSRMEQELDSISTGKQNYEQVVINFFNNIFSVVNLKKYDTKDNSEKLEMQLWSKEALNIEDNMLMYDYEGFKIYKKFSYYFVFRDSSLIGYIFDKNLTDESNAVEIVARSVMPIEYNKSNYVFCYKSKLQLKTWRQEIVIKDLEFTNIEKNIFNSIKN